MIKFIKTISIYLLMATSALSTFAQSPLLGDWSGTLQIQGTSLRLVFHISEGESGLTTTMDSPDQNAFNMPTDATTFEAGTLTIKNAQIGMTYTGKLEGEKLVGTFQQGPVKVPLEMVQEEPSAPEPAPDLAPLNMAEVKPLMGDWNGTLNIQGMNLRLIFHITAEDNVLRTTMDSPDQNAFNLPTSSTTYAEGTLTIANKQIGMTYSGKLEGQKLVGTFRQGTVSAPLEMVREAQPKPEKKSRPQDPQEPFPYEVRDVQFPNPKADGIQLAGTLTLPEGVKNPPAVVLISGSGPQNRDEELLNHRPFAVLADYLSRRGIAVLRYDDRGVADSEGSFSTATSADFATDAYAAVQFLQQHPALTGSPIGLAGHSEGGLIAPMVASQHEDIDFIVLLAGPGTPSLQILSDQSRLIGGAQGIPTEVTEINLRALNKAHQTLLDHPDVEEETLKELMKEALRPILEQFPDSTQEELGGLNAFLEQEVKQLTTPWFRYFLTYDPMPYLRQVKCPVLAISGSLDLQVPSEANLAGIQQALSEGGNEQVRIHEFPALNHLFQPTETGSPAEYGEIETTLAPEMMEMVEQWIQETVGK